MLYNIKIYETELNRKQNFDRHQGEEIAASIKKNYKGNIPGGEIKEEM